MSTPGEAGSCRMVPAPATCSSRTACSRGGPGRRGAAGPWRGVARGRREEAAAAAAAPPCRGGLGAPPQRGNSRSSFVLRRAGGRRLQPPRPPKHRPAAAAPRAGEAAAPQPASPPPLGRHRDRSWAPGSSGGGSSLRLSGVLHR